MSLNVRNVEYFYVRIHDAPEKASGGGRYGYVVYFKEEDHRSAAKALGAVTTPQENPG
jgi:hypothetical protein